MAEKPTVSVIMPAFNAAETVDPAVRSVLAQTRGDFELIVVDDGSTDETVERVRQHESDGRVRLIRQERRGAPAPTRNTGLAAARGRFAAFIDSDDLWMPRFLEAMVAALEADSAAGLAYTDGWVLDHRTRRIQRPTAMAYQDPPLPPPSDPVELLRLLLQRNFILAAATVPRDVLDAVGGFNEELEAAEDYELWLRIVANGYRAVRPPGLLAVYRKRAGTLSTDDLRTYRALRQIHRLVLGHYDLPDELVPVARARLEEVERILAGIAGEGLGPTLRFRARSFAISAKRALLRPYYYRRRPPPELAAAFPDLRRV